MRTNRQEDKLALRRELEAAKERFLSEGGYITEYLPYNKVLVHCQDHTLSFNTREEFERWKNDY